MKSPNTTVRCLAAGAALLAAAIAAAGTGTAITTSNPWVDGFSKDICRNSLTNCNIYGKKEAVWLKGDLQGAEVGADGFYFFAVLEPGGESNPNDGGPLNLSDDYDTYLSRIFTVSGGVISDYGGTHDLDSGGSLDPGRSYCSKIFSCEPDGYPPMIRLYPYADALNSGRVYILAVCSLADGYPVNPTDCKYDAFRVGQ